ncbi:VOC family protein [Paenibacillus beijingensis]|uniref:VOC domain-containing protein n=1 Tax=Paenibacillus beijingensis TaxID=1126833 RepID=A0A0D5NM29_9BACL|nr:VOC family protein [Paenibacillus beijingensis]AJY76190.1 hypothetical protein VN24_18505 [Paenibacillus beijingensis]
MSIIERIDGIFIPVTDMDRSVEWYKEILGLDLLYRWEGGAGFKVYNGESLLGLIQVTEHTPAFFKTQTSKMHFFNFKTFDIEESCNKLRERGVDINEIVDAGKVKLAYFLDPDGNLLGLCEEVN